MIFFIVVVGVRSFSCAHHVITRHKTKIPWRRPVCILYWMDRQVSRGFWFWFSLFLSFWNCTWNTPEHLTHDSSGVTHIKPSAGRRLYSWSERANDWCYSAAFLFLFAKPALIYLFMYLCIYIFIDNHGPDFTLSTNTVDLAADGLLICLLWKGFVCVCGK